jgi:hypothetical protein
MSNNISTQLWNALSYNCPPNHWRAVLNNDGVIASVHTLKVDNTLKIVHQQIITCGFDATIVDDYVDNTSSNVSDNDLKYI